MNDIDPRSISAGNYMFKVNNREYIKHISHLVLVFLLLTLSRYIQAGMNEKAMNGDLSGNDKLEMILRF